MEKRGEKEKKREGKRGNLHFRSASFEQTTRMGRRKTKLGRRIFYVGKKKSYVPVSFLQIGSQNPEMRKEKKEEFSQKFSQFKREKIAPISSSNSPTPRDEKSY